MIDIKTLSLCIVGINVFLCIALFAAWKVQKVYAGFGFWVLANFAMAFGYVVMVFARDIFSPLLNNMLFFLAVWLRFEGLNLFLEKKHRRYPHLIGMFVVLLVLLFFSDDMPKRTVVISCALAFYLYWMTWDLIVHARGEVRGHYQVAAALFLIYGLLLTSRAVIALAAPSQIIIPDPTAGNAFFFLFLMLLDIGVIFAFLMMNDKRLAVELGETEESLVRVQESIRNSLREKEILLREIHHRVKNNLQIIASLLNLQTDHTDDPKAMEILRESRDRIQTMADIHSMLYQSKDLANIDFEDYLRQLARSLLRSYQADPEKIAIKIEAKEILFSIATAVPCSLLINEIVANALKHAFPKGRSGEIRIEMASSGNTITLVICDNGIGIPEQIDFKNTETLGLQLVTALVDQLRGSIEVSRKGGTQYRIVFTAGTHKKEAPSWPEAKS
jgi:two-component sensor histidine kinase